MIYKAQQDNLSKWISIIFLIIFLALLSATIINPKPVSWIVTPILALATIITYIFHPRYYTISNEGINIHHPFTKKTIPFQNIKSYSSVSWKDLGYPIRLFGSGGLFGYLGLYRFSKIGKVWMNCSSKENLILIQEEKQQWMISPKNDTEFLKELASYNNN